MGLGAHRPSLADFQIEQKLIGSEIASSGQARRSFANPESAIHR
jgi:hypothetical protein